MPIVYPVIMSGGSGTRLWPLSRRAHPKQLLALTSERTMLQETAARVQAGSGPAQFGPLFVIGNAAHKEAVETQLSGCAVRLQALEPFGRNTAPAAAVAALLVAREAPDAILMLLAADHFIADIPAFHQAVAKAAGEAADGQIVTFGIVPDAPETGYGYIHMAPAMSVHGAHKVVEFVEKPDRETALRYLAEGHYAWNSGMFVSRADVLLDEMKLHCPQIVIAATKAVEKGVTRGSALYLDEEAFSDCTDISIDYAVMERTTRSSVLPVSMGWSDVGSWKALWEIGERDANGNVVSGDVLMSDVSDCYIKATCRAVAVVGVENLVVVESEDAVLVLPMERAQDVKLIVEQLKAAKRREL